MNLWRSKTKLFCETSFKNDIWCFKSTAPATKKLSRGIRSPVTATRNDHCKVTLPWHEICNPSTVSASEASNIDITKREITAPATRNASFQTLFKSPTPANVFATLTNSCACHVFCNVSKSLRLPRETHFQPPKTSRAPGVLTILTSKSLSRAGVVQILRSSTSKSIPIMPRFNDFDFRIALARRRGANFVDVNFQQCPDTASFYRFSLPNRSRAQAWCKFCRCELAKVVRSCQFLTISTSESLSRAGVVQILSTSWAADPSHHLAFRTYLCEPSKPRNYGKTQHFAQFLPAKTSLLSNIDAARATGNFQYSRKLELLNFLWS